jgi:16S rRNA (cytosine1402-N4)-methyltransferase
VVTDIENGVGGIKTTEQLSSIIKKAYPAFARFGKLHPATRTFQALRIAVNDELRAIEDALPQALRALKKGGRLEVISFHSLEDRIVKRFFKNASDEGLVKMITKKPTIPTEEEIKENPRSRSSKLRIVEKN